MLESPTSAGCPLDHHQQDPTSVSTYTSPPSAPLQNGSKTTPGTARLIQSRPSSTGPGIPAGSNQPLRKTSPERSSALRLPRPRTSPPPTHTSTLQTRALTLRNPISTLRTRADGHWSRHPGTKIRYLHQKIPKIMIPSQPLP